VTHRGGRQCRRDNCKGKPSHGYEYHHILCKLVDDQMTKAQADIRLVGPGRVSTELWVNAVALNDALTEFQRSWRLMQTMVKRHNESSDQSNETSSLTPETYYPANESDTQQ
jgi:hypothetical protein